MTNELSALNDLPGYSFALKTNQDKYNDYRQNTLGYLQQKIKEESNGKFDAIRPIIIDGKPQYIFIDSSEDLNQATMPLSHLYQPIIVSPDKAKYINQEAKIEINIKCAYAPTTQGIDVYQNIIPEEKELFASKIPLSNIAFTYTIKSVEIELIENTIAGPKIVLSPKIITEDDYNVEMGNLYLKEAIDNIFFPNQGAFNLLATEGIIDLSSSFYYRLKITFDLVVEDSGSSDHKRMALAQATSYAVMDYFNQYTYASVTANMIGEIAYTETLTLISTLITAPVLLIGGWTTKGVENVITKTGVKGVTATILKTALIAGKIINALLIAPIKEVFEEIITDGFIETWAERQVELWGGTEDMGFWFSALCTSGRETLSGSYKGVKTMMKTKSTQIKTINLGLKNSDNLQTWVAQQSGKDYNSDSKFRKDVLKQIEKLHNDGETNILLKTEKKNSLLKIAYSGITTAFKFTLFSMFLGSQTMSSVLSMSGFTSSIKGIRASLYGRRSTNLHNAKASDILGQREALKNLRNEIGPEEYFLNQKSDIDQGAYENAWAEWTAGEQMPSTNIQVEAPNNVKEGIISKIEKKFSYKQAFTTLVGSLSMMFSVRKISDFTSEKIKKTKLDTKPSLQTVSTDRHVVEIAVEDLTTRDERGFFKRNDINEWDKKSKKFVLIDKSDLTIDEVLLYIKKQFNINPKSTMKFYSETLGYLDYAITDSKKKVYFTKTVDIGGKTITIDPSTKFSEIAEISDLVVKFSVKNDFNNLAGYKVGRTQFSYILKGTGNFERAFDTEAKANVMHELVKGIKVKGKVIWKGIENYAKKYLKENGLYPDALAMYKSALKTSLQSQIDTVYKNDVLINKIKAACKTEEDITLALKEYDQLIKNIFEAQFKTLTDKITNKVAKQYLEECAQQLIFANILTMLNADKKKGLGGISIYSLASELDKFLKNSQEIKVFEEDHLKPSKLSTSKAALLKQVAGGYFDQAQQEKPQLTRNMQMLIGRLQETNDFFGNMPSRIVEAFIENNFEVPKGFNGVNYGSRNSPLDLNTHLGDFDNLMKIEEIVLGVSSDWTEVFESYSINTPSDRRFFDNLLVIFTTIFLASPNKGSVLNNLGKTKIQDMVNDFSSTQISAFFVEIAKGLQSGNFDLKNIRKFAGTLCGPSSDPDLSLEIFIKELFLNRKELDDFRAGKKGKDLKAPSKYTFLFAIAEWLGDNAELGEADSKEDAIRTVLEYFQSFNDETHENFGKFQEKIDSIAAKYYKAKYIEKLGTNFYDTLRSLFSNKKFLSQMIRKGGSGTGFQILWKDHVTPLFEAKGIDKKPIKLKRNMIPTSINGKPVYVLDANKWVKITDLRSSYSFDAAHIFVYRLLENGKKEVGLARIDSINNDFSNARDSTNNIIDIYEGFATESGTIINGAWLSNAKGNVMLSEVKLEDFSVRSQNWYEDFLEIESGILKNNLFMSYIIASGSKLTCLLQETEVNFQVYDAYSQFFPDIIMENIKNFKLVKEETIVKNLNPKKSAINKVSALHNVMFQISETSTESGESGIARVVPSTPFLSFSSEDGQKYTVSSLNNLFKSITPKSTDALYDPSSPIYTSQDKPHFDSGDQNYWLKMITRFQIEGVQKGLTGIEKKRLYNAMLLLIQNDLYMKSAGEWVLNPDSVFKDFEFLLSESFTSDDDFLIDETDANQDKWKDDFALASKIDIALHDKLGLTSFASLFSGLMTYSETTSGNFHIDFVLHSLKDQNDLNSKYDIRPLDYRYGDTSSLGSQYLKIKTDTSRFFGSIFSNGFSHTLEGRKDTQSGSTDIVVTQYVKPSTKAFLNDYFTVYNPRDYGDYKEAIDLIFEGYLSKVSNRKQRNKANFIGRDKLYNFLAKKAEDLIDIIFKPLKDAKYTQFDQFLGNREVWKSRTLKQAKIYLRKYIDKPATAYDFIGTLRKILRTGKDGYITLIASQVNYRGNALFEQGLQIPIAYDDLVKFLSFDNLADLSTDALFTIGFQYRSNGENQMSPQGYFQDANQWWGINKDKISLKTVKAYNALISAFTLERLGKDLFNKEYTLNLVTDKGKGVYQKTTIADRYKSYGITDHRITFNPSDPKSLENAIASMITYLFFFPDTFAVIKLGNKNFLFADAFNIHTPEYVAASDYTEGTVKGTFMWSQDESVNGLTRENYNTLIAAYGDNFNDRDVRSLLRFSNENIVSLLLNNFQTIFRERINNKIEIRDLRIHSLVLF